MNNKIILTILELVIDIFRGLALITLISPVIIYQFIHGDTDRYIWLISGPEPFNKFGGGPYQLYMYLTLVITGIALFVLTSFIKKIVEARRIYE